MVFPLLCKLSWEYFQNSIHSTVIKEKPRKILKECPRLVPCTATGTAPEVFQIIYILLYHDALKWFTVVLCVPVYVPASCFKLAAGNPFSAHKQKINSAEIGRTTTGILWRLKKFNFLQVTSDINILQNSFSTVAKAFKIIIVLLSIPVTTKGIFYTNLKHTKFTIAGTSNDKFLILICND